jgi:hypothetical protein
MEAKKHRDPGHSYLPLCLSFSCMGLTPTVGSFSQANDWASEYQREQETDPQGWAQEFSQSQGPKDWADEFGDQVAKGAFEGDESGWVDSYNQFLDENRGGEASTSNMCVCS